MRNWDDGGNGIERLCDWSKASWPFRQTLVGKQSFGPTFYYQQGLSVQNCRFYEL